MAPPAHRLTGRRARATVTVARARPQTQHKRMDPSDSASRLILRLVIILGITLLYPAVIYLGTAAVVERPVRADFSESLPQKGSAEDRAKWHDSLRAAQAAYKEAQATFAGILFWVAMPLALAALCAGLFRRLGDIGIGFLSGGLATLFFAHCATWAHYDADAGRFVVALFAIGLLILVARKRLMA